MPPIKIVNEQSELVPTKNFQHAKFSFTEFNPVQSRIFDYFDKDVNLVVASATSSGKTVVAEVILSYEIRKNNKKGIYLVPLKALATEKYSDWTDPSHHFSDLKIAICTGDYTITPERKLELQEADILIMSSEMLNSKSRTKNNFLENKDILIVDEFHNIAAPNRGSHLECGVMRFTENHSDARLVLLSATMPNVSELAEWVSYVLTKKETVLIKSNYRPCKLTIHYEKYDDSAYKYDDKEKEKVEVAAEIVSHYPDDKFLIFAHTKRTGNLMKDYLIENGIDCDFHCADLTREKRVKLEDKFRKDPKFRVLVASSTLAQGLNTPARRVIILGVHRGLSDVPVSEIMQECGRSGRPGYDKYGDAYILLPESDFDYHKMLLKTSETIRSQMLNEFFDYYQELAFHIVNEIYQGTIQSVDDVKTWFSRTLASFQAHELNGKILRKTLDLLKTKGVIWEEEGKLTCTSIGKISSMYYYNPLDVADLKKNFTALFDGNLESNDYMTSIALANTTSNKSGIVNKAEWEQIKNFYDKVSKISDQELKDSVIKAAYCYHCCMNGTNNSIVASSIRNLQADFPRLLQVIQSIDSFVGKWDKEDWFKELKLRLNYGAPKHLLSLCEIPSIGKVRSEKLYKAGIKNVKDFLNNVDKAQKILKFKDAKMNEIIEKVKK